MSERAQMERIEKNMNFDTPTRIAYIDVDNPIIYNYPTEDYESSISNLEIEKDEEIIVIQENDTWVKFKTNNTSSNYYILKSNIRDNYYKEELNSFVLNIIAPKEIAVYEFMNKDSKVLYKYQENDEMVAIGYNDEYYQVKNGNKIGFVDKEDFKLSKAEITSNIGVSVDEDLDFFPIVIFMICLFILIIIILYINW